MFGRGFTIAYALLLISSGLLHFKFYFNSFFFNLVAFIGISRAAEDEAEGEQQETPPTQAVK
jgi:hypothetical protein